MLEVEVKYAVEDLKPLAAALAGWSAGETRRDEDHYFNAPDRDFARTDEALRVRSIGPRNYITYKGPKTDAETKTRFELELPLGDGPESAAQFRRLLTRLGYRPGGVVRKARRVFRSHRDGFDVQATLDDVDGLGTFAELEITADEDQLPAARAAVLGAAAELGLTQAERRSYLQLLLEKQSPARDVKTITTVVELRRAVGGARRSGLTVGLVPTMGALHAGHAALVERARAECGFVVVSVFVNPTQFGPNEDFGCYPRTFDADLDLCKRLGVDVVFAPPAEEVYPPGFVTHVEVGPLATVFEGAIRPGHFRGVATVVLKLFNMVQPDVTFFGQKDAQQVAVVRQLIRDFDLPVRLAVVPTVREADGLALSSRNRYLDATQRQQAVVLFRALAAVRDNWATGERDPAMLAEAMTRVAATASAVAFDYAAVVDAQTFSPPAADGPALAIIAARLGSTRLIDNLPLGDSQPPRQLS